MQALFNIEVLQQQRKEWHDKNIKHSKFKEGDWALLYYSRLNEFKGNLMTMWLRPYIIKKCYNNGSIQIRTIDEEGIPLLANGFGPNIYNKPQPKEDFTKIMRTQNMDVMDIIYALNTSQ
jgi:hypothetical protein